MTIYLNPFLRVSLRTMPGASALQIVFPEGQETFLLPPDHPKRDTAKRECPLEALNSEERDMLTRAVRTLRPATESSLPWTTPPASSPPGLPNDTLAPVEHGGDEDHATAAPLNDSLKVPISSSMPAKPTPIPSVSTPPAPKLSAPDTYYFIVCRRCTLPSKIAS